MEEYSEVECPHCKEMIPKSLSTCPACKKPAKITPTETVNTNWQRKPDSPSLDNFPCCRSANRIDLTKLFVGGIVILIVGSCVAGIAKNKLFPPPQQTVTAPVQSPPEKYMDTNSIIVRGKDISTGDLADDVFAIIHQSDMVDQVVIPNKEHPGSMFVVKTFDVDGKKFKLHLARVQDPGPYKVIGIETAQ